MSEAEALEIAAEFYASGEPERIAALPPVAGLSYEQIVARDARPVCLRVEEEAERMVV